MKPLSVTNLLTNPVANKGLVYDMLRSRIGPVGVRAPLAVSWVTAKTAV